MRHVMEELGPTFITIAVSAVLIGITVGFFRGGGLLNRMISEYLSSICA